MAKAQKSIPVDLDDLERRLRRMSFADRIECYDAVNKAIDDGKPVTLGAVSLVRRYAAPALWARRWESSGRAYENGIYGSRGVMA